MWYEVMLIIQLYPPYGDNISITFNTNMTMILYETNI